MQKRTVVRGYRVGISSVGVAAEINISKEIQDMKILEICGAMGSASSEINDLLRLFDPERMERNALLANDEQELAKVLVKLGAGANYSPSMPVLSLLRDLNAKLKLAPSDKTSE